MLQNVDFLRKTPKITRFARLLLGAQATTAKEPAEVAGDAADAAAGPTAEAPVNLQRLQQEMVAQRLQQQEQHPRGISGHICILYMSIYDHIWLYISIYSHICDYIYL